MWNHSLRTSSFNFSTRCCAIVSSTYRDLFSLGLTVSSIDWNSVLLLIRQLMTSLNRPFIRLKGIIKKKLTWLGPPHKGSRKWLQCRGSRHRTAPAGTHKGWKNGAGCTHTAISGIDGGCSTEWNASGRLAREAQLCARSAASSLGTCPSPSPSSWTS